MSPATTTITNLPVTVVCSNALTTTMTVTMAHSSMRIAELLVNMIWFSHHH